MTLFAEFPVVKTRTMVARNLLERCENPESFRRFDQRGMATQIGLDWKVVHNSLKSLCDEGAVKLDRHRIIININKLQEIAK